MENSEKQRLDWIDAARGIAMIFVYLGHWTTAKLTGFAYSFHLQLFFIISGFFAVSQQKYTAVTYVKKQLLSITVPMLLWCWVSSVINVMDTGARGASDLKNILLSPASIQVNYWFMPVLLGTSLCYYFLYRLIKNKWILLAISGAVFLLCSETGILPTEYNIFIIIEKIPFMPIFTQYCSVAGIATYLFWYALGAAVFELICRFMAAAEKKNRICNAVGIAAAAAASLLFSYKVTEIPVIPALINGSGGAAAFLWCLYKAAAAAGISFSVLYLCIYLQNSKVLLFIGKNTMALMGIEFITHGYIALCLLPMMNLGIPNASSTMSVITLTLGQLAVNYPLILLINRCFPALNGKLKPQEIRYRKTEEKGVSTNA